MPPPGITTDQATYRLERALGMPHDAERNINRACVAYANGRLTIHKLEAAVEHVLRGGYLNSNLELRSPLLDRVRARRRCANEGHSLIDVTGFGSTGVVICSRCDYREP